MNKKFLSFFLIFSFIALPFLAFKICQTYAEPPCYEEERCDGSYFTILDDKGKIIHKTAHCLYKGDEFISAANIRYKINKIKGDFAYAKVVKEKEQQESFWTRVLPAELGSQAQKRLIGIYHTHTDESYVPTDGTSSRYADGGIIKVGTTLTEKLRSEGFEVQHSARPHDPHDANAYYRSRRTAVQLLKDRPAAIIDVHRDAVPADVYEATINGEQVTKVKFVIGRENPRMSANLQFAKELKSVLDKKHPGLVEGILISRGNYNQDLGPRALLVEVGSHTNSRVDAQEGVALFADALPDVLGVAGVRPDIPAQNKGDWRAVFWVVLIVGGLLAGFLYMNTGSWKGSWGQLLRFFKREFGGKKNGGE